MNIRIGNDIKFNIALDETKLSGKVIDKAKCYLVNNFECADISFPKSYIPTEYTIRGCGAMGYNVLPVDPHHCGFSVCEGRFLGIEHKHDYCALATIISDTLITFEYPAINQHKVGNYRLVVETVVKQDDKFNVYTFDFGNVLTLTRDKDAQSGETVIDIPVDNSFISGSIGSASIDDVVSAAQWVKLNGEGLMFDGALRDNSVTESKIVSGAVTLAKLGIDVNSILTSLIEKTNTTISWVSFVHETDGTLHPKFQHTDDEISESIGIAIPTATVAKDGLMSKSDKEKLDTVVSDFDTHREMSEQTLGDLAQMILTETNRAQEAEQAINAKIGKVTLNDLADDVFERLHAMDENLEDEIKIRQTSVGNLGLMIGNETNRAKLAEESLATLLKPIIIGAGFDRTLRKYVVYENKSSNLDMLISIKSMTDTQMMEYMHKCNIWVCCNDVHCRASFSCIDGNLIASGQTVDSNATNLTLVDILINSDSVSDWIVNSRSFDLNVQ